MKKFLAFFVMAAFLLVSCNNTESSSSKDSKEKDSKEVKGGESSDPITAKLIKIEKTIDAGDLQEAENLMNSFGQSIDPNFEPNDEQKQIIDRIDTKYAKAVQDKYSDMYGDEEDADEADDWED